MTLQHFWLFLTVASLAWYTLVTAYVAWKGFADIRQMLRILRHGHRDEEETDGR